LTKSSAVIIAFLIGVTACNDGTQKKPRSSAKYVREIDKIKLTDLNGKGIYIKEGKTIFINFWATWCKPCIREMPSIEKAQNIVSNKNIIFLMASNESIDDIKKFSNDVGYKLNYVRIENSEEMNIEALPVTNIYNAKGKLVFSEAGMRKWDDKNNIDLILKIANQK